MRGQGAYQLPLADPLSTGAGTRLAIPATTPATLNFLESVEKAHAKLSFNERVGQILGVTRPPTRMDSQAKYCSLARGDGAVYLRMPTGTGYREKIWVMSTLFLSSTLRADTSAGPHAWRGARRGGWGHYH